MKEDKGKKPSKGFKAVQMVTFGIATIIGLYGFIRFVIPGLWGNFCRDWDWEAFWIIIVFIGAIYFLQRVCDFYKSYKGLKTNNEYLQRELKYYKNEYSKLWAETDEGRKAIQELRDQE